MSQSLVHITTNELREFYRNALGKKIAEFKKFNESIPNDPKHTHPMTAHESNIRRYIIDAISFRNMFDIKTATFSLTRDDIDLLTRILNTSA